MSSLNPHPHFLLKSPDSDCLLGAHRHLHASRQVFFRTLVMCGLVLPAQPVCGSPRWQPRLPPSCSSDAVSTGTSSGCFWQPSGVLQRHGNYRGGLGGTNPEEFGSEAGVSIQITYLRLDLVQGIVMGWYFITHTSVKVSQPVLCRGCQNKF